MDGAAADIELEQGTVSGVLRITRQPSGQLAVDFRTNGSPDGVRSQLMGFAALGIGIYDWTASLPPDSQLGRVPDPGLHDRRDARADRRREADRPAGGREPRLPRDRVRRAAVPDRDHLRHVGRDRRRHREEQPRHGADDQRRVAAADADRQGRRHRRRRADAVPADRGPGAARARPSRTRSPRGSSARAGRPGRRSSA